jgi:hypothetical protein
MSQKTVLSPDEQSVQRDILARKNKKPATLPSFDDLVVDHSLVPVVVRVIPTGSEHRPSIVGDDLLIELQCEV